MRHQRPRHHLYSGDVVCYRPEPPLPGVEAVVHTTGPTWIGIGYRASGPCEFSSLLPRYGFPIIETTLRHAFEFTHYLWVPYYHLSLVRRDWLTLQGEPT